VKSYQSDALRNIAVVGPSNSGKTSLVEAMLFDVGAIDRMGRVEDGNTVSDFDEEEVRRQMSIGLSLCAIEHGDRKLNLMDCPGYTDFVAGVIYPLHITEGAIVLVDAAGGLGVGTERAWRMAEERGVARIVFINKLDKENTSFEQSLDAVKERLSSAAAPLCLPIGSGASLTGVVDLVTMKAYIGAGAGVKASDIPAEMADEAQAARERMVEEIAASDEALMEKYFEDGDLSQDDLVKGLLAGVLAGKVVPVLAGSATENIGVMQLLAAAKDLLPPPGSRPVEGIKPGTEGGADGPERVTREAASDAPTSALAFRSVMHPYQGKLVLVRVWSGRLKQDMSLQNTTQGQKEKLGEVFTMRGKTQEKLTEAYAGDIVGIAKIQGTRTGDTLSDPGHPIVLPAPVIPEPMFSASISCKDRSEVDKLASGLAKIAEEDVGFRFYRDPETDESIIAGVGRLHLEVVLSKLKSATGVEVEMGRPKIPYRETIRSKATIHHRYKKQTGGRGQFGDVHLRLEPRESGSGFEFLDEVVGGAIPRQYIPAVEKGVIEAMAHGCLASFPVVDVAVAVFDGQYHSVDSSEHAFKRAAAMAFRKGMEQAHPILLEPIVRIQITAPDDAMGDIMGDLTSRRGRPQGMEQQGSTQIINALVPLAEVATYEADLRSMTGGRASYTMEHAKYEEVPAHLVDAICAEHKREIEEED